MAKNLRKSFNFRSGLQVDEDIFVVSSNGAVGIGTSIPIGHILDVRGDISASGFVTSRNLYASNTASVGFLTALNAYAGILTVNQLRVGTSLVNNLVGYAYTGWVTTNPVGLTTTARVGIGTDVIPDEQLKVNGNVSVVGILTATSFNGSGASLTNIPNSATTATNANTASAIVSRDASGNFSAGTITATLNGSSSSASALTGSPSITVTDVSASNVSATGIVAATTELNVGTGGNALTALNTGRLGIGTALPTSELQIRKASGSFLQVVSDSGEARISVGNSLDAGKSTGVIRFGNSVNDLDIINNDNEGDINFLLNGNGSAGSGKFSWQDGSTFNEVMSLDANGNFSVSGVTTLASVGGITTTGGDLYVGNNLYVDGNINGTITLPTIIDSNINVNSGISTFATINVANLGLGTDSPLSALDAQSATGLFGSIGIGTTTSLGNKLVVEGGLAQFSSVGIGTTTLYNDPGGGNTGNFQVHNTNLSITNGSLVVKDTAISAIGYGTYSPRSIIDFGNVGLAETTGFMILPTLTTTQRGNLAYEIEGAIIFNATTKKFQGYTGTVWVDLH